MKQATHFIEATKRDDFVKYSRPVPIRLFTWCMEVNFNHSFETVAIFKIYPKVKPMLAHYDNNVNAIIIE